MRRFAGGKSRIDAPGGVSKPQCDEAVIADIRQKMADCGITLDELQKPARTRATGGKKAGAKREEFLIKRK